MKVSGLVVVLLVMWVRLARSQELYQLHFNITEGQESGIFVGNTAVVTGLFSTTNPEDFQLVTFQLFDRGNPNAAYFRVDSQSGVIRTASVIDRESLCKNSQTCIVTLDIGVWRQTSPSGSSEIYKSIRASISIEDKNDNPPEFPQKVVTLTMPENMPAPYRLYTSVATDADKMGDNSEISYQLESGYPIFSLLEERSPENGLADLVIVVNKMLDREDVDSYHVTIIATDKGVPKLSGSLMVNIDVTDANDNQPTFLQSNYSVDVMENASIVDPILTVSAVDRDVNDNGRVVYQLSSRVSQEIRDTFRVGESDGRIYLTRPIDYETKTRFQFFVEAADRGTPPQSATAFVVVNVIDVNDNAPQIRLTLSPDGTDVVENSPPGKFLGHFAVSDLDSGASGNVVCEIRDNNFRLENFDGQPNVYKILLAQSLDHEDLAVRQVTIRCQDRDKNPLIATKTFEVKVVDVNDNRPVFMQSAFTGVVLENRLEGTNVQPMFADIRADGFNVLTVSAEDADGGDNGRVSYYIQGGSNFSVDSLTGTISTLVAFDREIQDRYQFVVVAQDHGAPQLSSTATITVSILDQNDNPPQFLQPVFNLEVRENLEPGSSVGDVVAIDRDTDPNSRMVYTIVRDDDNSRYFSVDRDTGLITSNQMFDRESRSSYMFSVNVQDPMVSSYRDLASVFVTVKDENDNDPEIVNPTPANNTITLPNNTTIGTTVLVVRARDPDGPETTRFEYFLDRSDSDGLFQVMTETGSFILAREIEKDDAKRHVIVVGVSDGGPRPRTATATLFITIPAEGLQAAAVANILDEPNFLIVVIIISVTVLAVLLIVAAICIIFRRDKHRRSGRAQQRQVKDKMYQAAQWVSTQSLPLAKDNGSMSVREVSRGSDSSGEVKRCKKEVSFSLGDELEKDAYGDADTSGSFGSVFCSQAVTTPDNNNLKPPGDGRFVFVNGKTLGSTGSTHCYESSDSHLYQNTPVAETDDGLNLQIGRRGEDALSESSGETGTDSGRGGSEDEVHSNRGSSLETDPRMFHLKQPVASSGFSTFASDRAKRKPPSLSSLPEEQHRQLLHDPHQPQRYHPAVQQLQQQPQQQQRRPIEQESGQPVSQRHDYFRSSAEQLPTHGLGYPPPPPPLASRDTYVTVDRSRAEGPFRMRDAAPARRTFQTFGPQYQNTHPAWRRAKGLDGGRRFASPTPGSYAATPDLTPTTATTDDDELTTTSGSYTISPDDPQTDGEEAPFPQQQHHHHSNHQPHDVMV